MITARLVSEIDDFETLYLLGSQGVYTDPTFTGSAAQRTVYQYAIKREVAMNHVAMMTQVTGDLYVEDDAHIDGNEEAGAGCPQASVDITALIMGSGSVTVQAGDDPIDGPNPEIVFLGTSAAALNAIGIDWAVLTDPAFPVDYENTWPSCALPVDSFTVTRFNGNLSSSPPVQPPGRPDCDGELYRGRPDSSGTAFCSPATSLLPPTTTGSTGWSWVAWTATGPSPGWTTTPTSITIAVTPLKRASA